MAKGKKKAQKKKAAKAATLTAIAPAQPPAESSETSHRAIAVPLAEQKQKTELERLVSFPTPTKSNGKDLMTQEKTPEYVWKAAYAPGSAWADQTDSDMYNRSRERNSNKTPTVMGKNGDERSAKKLSMTPGDDNASDSPVKMTEMSVGKIDEVVREQTNASPVTSVADKATRAPSPLSATSNKFALREPATAPAQQPDVARAPTPPRAVVPTPKAQPAATTVATAATTTTTTTNISAAKIPTPKKSFLERTFTPAKDKLENNPLIAEIVREREQAAEVKKKQEEKKNRAPTAAEKALENLKENKIAAIGIGAMAIAFLLKRIGEAQKTKA